MSEICLRSSRVARGAPAAGLAAPATSASRELYSYLSHSSFTRILFLAGVSLGVTSESLSRGRGSAVLAAACNGMLVPSPIAIATVAVSRNPGIAAIVHRSYCGLFGHGLARRRVRGGAWPRPVALCKPPHGGSEGERESERVGSHANTHCVFFCLWRRSDPFSPI